MRLCVPVELSRCCLCEGECRGPRSPGWFWVTGPAGVAGDRNVPDFQRRFWNLSQRAESAGGLCLETAAMIESINTSFPLPRERLLPLCCVLVFRGCHTTKPSLSLLERRSLQFGLLAYPQVLV